MNSLLTFASYAYANHDSAHNLEHAKNVLRNALTIIEKEGINCDAVEERELPYVMIGHDFRDHKLVERGLCCTAEEIEDFYRKELGEGSAAKILHIHDNCSWSKRKSSIPLESGDWMRKVLQDADWLEAIGNVGLQRCINYNSSVRGVTDAMLIQDVCLHIREKLLLIPTELNYESSREIAKDRIAPLLDFLRENEK